MVAEPGGWTFEERTIGHLRWTHESGAELRLVNVSDPPEAERALELDGDEAYAWTEERDGSKNRAQDAMTLFEPGMTADELGAALDSKYHTGLDDFA